MKASAGDDWVKVKHAQAAKDYGRYCMTAPAYHMPGEMWVQRDAKALPKHHCEVSAICMRLRTTYGWQVNAQRLLQVYDKGMN